MKSKIVEQEETATLLYVVDSDNFSLMNLYSMKKNLRWNEILERICVLLVNKNNVGGKVVGYSVLKPNSF